jgi:hypothetical protein
MARSLISGEIHHVAEKNELSEQFNFDYYAGKHAYEPSTLERPACTDQTPDSWQALPFEVAGVTGPVLWSAWRQTFPETVGEFSALSPVSGGILLTRSATVGAETRA